MGKNVCAISPPNFGNWPTRQARKKSELHSSPGRCGDVGGDGSFPLFPQVHVISTPHPPTAGCPIFRALCERWDSTTLDLLGFSPFDKPSSIGGTQLSLEQKRLCRSQNPARI